jgi:hypothetical protein
MRPITIDVQSQHNLYSQQLELNQVVRAKIHDVGYDKGQEPPSKKRRNTGHVVEDVTVEAVIESIEALLAGNWDAQAKWNTTNNRQTWERLVGNAGAGYENASTDLMTQTGSYCAFCDTPLASGLNATPFKPLKWFPQNAFDANNLLLICPACNAAREDKPRRHDTTVYALPTSYWQGLQDNSLLPFEYKLTKISGFEFTPTPIPPELINSTLVLAAQLGFIRVDRSALFREAEVVVDLVDLVSIHNGAQNVAFPKFDSLYQLHDLARLLGLNTLKNLLENLSALFDAMNTQFRNFSLADVAESSEDVYTVDGLRLHFRLANTQEITNSLTRLLAVLNELKTHRKITLAVHAAARSFLPGANAIKATIELFKLNAVVPGYDGANFLDRRVELRTLAYFKALVMRDLWTKTLKDYPALQPIMLEQLKQTIAAAGFWGVWLNVFGSSIQNILREVMPGTAPTTWQG